jgi:hypothetical protein
MECAHHSSQKDRFSSVPVALCQEANETRDAFSFPAIILKAHPIT